MKIAYLILAHDQPVSFQRLIKALDAQSVHFFVHIDAKSNISEFNCFPEKANISFLENRITVNHGGFSLTQAVIHLLRAASELKRFDYFITLSGRDYPIKNSEYIETFLEKNFDANFINFYPLLSNTHLVQHIKKYHFVDLKRKYKFLKAPLYVMHKFLPDRPFVKGFIPYRGSQWWCLNRQTVNFIIQFLNAPENKIFTNFFSHVWGSDEIFFQTIVLNSPYASQCRFYERDILNSDKIMLNENKAYLHYIDWDLSREGPAILKEEDFQALRESEALFARKFDQVKSNTLLEKIDCCLLKT
jgi:hypothetical protein